MPTCVSTLTSPIKFGKHVSEFQRDRSSAVYTYIKPTWCVTVRIQGT